MVRLLGKVTAMRHAFDTADTLFKSGLTGLNERVWAKGELRQAERELIDGAKARVWLWRGSTSPWARRVWRRVEDHVGLTFPCESGNRKEPIV
jgi:hypothetical protein